MAELFEVVVVHGFGEASVESIAFFGDFEDASVGGAELLFVESFAEAFAGFGDFFFDFSVEFGEFLFDEDVGAVSFFGVAVVDEGVVEGVDVTGSFPNGGVHEDSGVDADDVFVEEGHSVPPVTFDVVFKFYAVLAVVVDSGEAIVDFR